MAKFRIRELAEASGIENAAMLSRKANIGQTTAYKLWDGSTFNPNIDTLLAIAEVLGVIVDELIVKEEDQSSRTDEGKIKPALLAVA